MENLSNLAKIVLDRLEPDIQKQKDWLERKQLYAPSKQPEMLAFKERIEEAKQRQEKVFVAGDYDCDGIMATSIMVDGLRHYGCTVGFYIPDRIKEGYGLSPKIVQLAYDKGYRLLVTVDNGVKASEALELAARLGMDSIVTDHHTIEEEVNCDILIHPDYLEKEFSTLCGGAIAFECIRVLGCDTPYHLELAALASIGDVMPVTYQTRRIIQNGLDALKQHRERHICGFIKDSKINETTVSFQIVPKINAIGRLSNMANANNVVRYFLSQDPLEIARLNQQIEEINTRRKRMSDEMCLSAYSKVKNQDAVLLIADPSFHEGIIGLVAGNLSSSLNKPVIVAAQNMDGYKLSMRSPAGFNCMDFLKCFSGYSSFGGHAQAAGFSLDFDRFHDFEQFVKYEGNRFIWTQAEEEPIAISADQVCIHEIEGLDQLRPFGPDFKCPTFAIDKPLIKNYYDFQNGKHRRYTLANGATCMRFNQPLFERNRSITQIKRFEGSLQISEYQGRRQANFMIEKVVYE